MRSNFEKPIGGQSVVNTVIERLTNAIIDGELRPGQKIPTEMELSQLWDVGRNSVREAIKCLVYIGVLDIRRSEGTFVASRFSDSMLNPLLYSLMLECEASDSLIELRRLFEVGTMSLAIEKADTDDMLALQHANEKITRLLSDEEADIDRVLESDLEFHRVLSAACHNSLLDRVNTVITRLTVPSRRKTITSFLERQRRAFMIEAHNKMCDVLMQRDDSQILPAVDFHYSYWEDWVTQNK